MGKTRPPSKKTGNFTDLTSPHSADRQDAPLADLVVVDDDPKIAVRCGSCGRPLRVALKKLLGLWTCDCRRCRRRLALERATALEDDEKTNALLAQIVESVSDAQLSALIRKVAGFSDREICETYGVNAGEIDDLVRRLTDRLRSLCRVEDDEKP